MRVPVAETRDNFARLLIRHIAVGTLVEPGRSGERRMGGEGHHEGPDCGLEMPQTNLAPQQLV